MLGTLHLKGSYGVAQDYRQAFRYFEQAAARGDLTGQSHLGFMYANGLGTEQNNETAIKLYKEAADKGNPQAQTNLGFMYWHGYHVPQDSAEAFRYFKLAADQGFPEAQVNLGSLYYCMCDNIVLLILIYSWGRCETRLFKSFYILSASCSTWQPCCSLQSR
jgi:TPR repeat protein